MAALVKTQVITLTSPASAITVVHGVRFAGLAAWDAFTLDCLIQGGTGGVLDMYLQRKLAANSWADWLHITQQGDGAAQNHITYDSSEISASPTTVGFGTGATPAVALAAGKFTCLHPGSEARIILVGGASTTAGAAQTFTLTQQQAAF